MYWSAVGAAGDEGEGAVIEVPLTEEDRILVDSSNANLKPKGGRVSHDMDDDEEMDDEPSELDVIEARDQAMMLPEGMKL